jgi:hypothetical protein
MILNSYKPTCRSGAIKNCENCSHKLGNRFHIRGVATVGFGVQNIYFLKQRKHPVNRLSKYLVC